MRTTRRPPLLALLLAAALWFMPSGASAAPAVGAAGDPLHAWAAGADPAALSAWVDARLLSAQRHIDRLAAVTGRRTVANTLVDYDAAINELNLANYQAYFIFSTGASAALRERAQQLAAKADSAYTDLSLNPLVYQALVAISPPTSDAPTRQYLARTLLEYRLAGVDRDVPTRAHIRELRDRITALTLAFSRNYTEDVRRLTVSRAELAGMPEDFIARHAPDADGRYTLTTDAPDSDPVADFAGNAALRHDMYLAYRQRGYPANQQVLMDMLTARQELATTLGFATYADLGIADTMMATTANLHDFLGAIDASSRPAAQREAAQLLAFARERDPTVTVIPASDQRYWSEQYRRAHYAFDAQSVRPYFPYAEVEAGVLAVTARLFHVQFRAARSASIWDPAVKALDVYDGRRRLGRVYLDMHPRAGKDKWSSNAPLVPGMRGRQLPEGALICNFPGGEAGDPGLLDYANVVTFFHEFGHLLHNVLGGQNRWAGLGSYSVEWDFVEAPSEMLEEFFQDHGILASFARHYQTGEPIPADLVTRMNAAGTYGRGQWWQLQLFYAHFLLELHDRDPKGIDLDELLRANAERYIPYEFVAGNRMYASIWHVTGYAANYYTYLLDKVIALDFFAQFDRDQLLDGPTALRYRRAVLEPGAAKPAAQLVRDFLGRPQSMGAVKDWIAEEFR